MANFKINISGHSMWPSLKDKETVFYTDDYNILEIGDIILYKDASKELVTHRIVTEDCTKGDRSYSKDLNYQAALGKVIGVENYYWKSGQPLKRLIALFSRIMLLPRPVCYLGLLFLIVTSKISFLLSSKSTKNHIEEILKLNP